jgi:GTPase SAR1 family protein
MNHSVSSTVTGKTKIKIVFLGGQAVGKSSIIEKYIHDRFEITANVKQTPFSQLSASIFSPKTYRISPKIIDFNCGIPLDKKDSGH